MSAKCGGRNPAAAPSLIVLMSFRLVIPWRVALQQSSPPLHQPGRLLTMAQSKATTLFDGLRQCLNFLSHEGGAPQTHADCSVAHEARGVCACVLSATW